jgi:hypothetical protein
LQREANWRTILILSAQIGTTQMDATGALKEGKGGGEWLAHGM